MREEDKGHHHRTLFERIGRRWRERVDKAKEYEVTEAEEVVDRGFIPSFLFDAEYQEAQRLKQRLLREYEGKKLEEVIDGEEFRTKNGVCYRITTQGKINLMSFTYQKARKAILSDFKLIYGIGEAKERILKEEGYRTIEDLTKHPRFGEQATKFLEVINRPDALRLINWIGHWLPKSHPLVLYVSGLYDKEDFTILDIESMGLFSRPIILIGIAQLSGDDILITQYFLRNIAEEPSVLAGFLSQVRGNCAFITFNGRNFDIPYIKERLVYYGMRANLDVPNFDVLYFSRRAWREKLPNCRLTTLEKYLLGIRRKDDVPSALVPEFYETYLRTGNIGPVIPIIEHNRQDLITLANIFSRLCEEWG